MEPTSPIELIGYALSAFLSMKTYHVFCQCKTEKAEEEQTKLDTAIQRQSLSPVLRANVAVETGTQR